MSQIDWSKAPEWAVAHALYAFGGEISEVWVGDEQYQRLDHPKSFPYGGGAASSFHNPRRHQFRYETPRPSPWNGEGLPPVGTICEYGTGNAWGECTVLHVGSLYMLISANGRGEVPIYHSSFCFRPVRTAEQIAADERDRGAHEIRKAVSKSPNCKAHGLEWDIACAIYDAGYRKQEPTQ